ncbi:MAG: multiheme c-type cytochrome [bacterium]
MRTPLAALFVISALAFLRSSPCASSQAGGAAPLSDRTQACLSCHTIYTQGIVADWEQSRHARSSVRQALSRPEKERRVSVQAPEEAGVAYPDVAVGCAECHLLDPKLHEDTFSHNGYEVHVVVSPPDCAHCHPVEQEQYLAANKMSRAHGNLAANPVYRDLAEAVAGVRRAGNGDLRSSGGREAAPYESCFACHGTRVAVLGTRKIDARTESVEVPDLSGWPNTGAGRVNPDGSLGACSACHPRHCFSMAAAREPRTCARCHEGPDVPAWNVYENSKHGVLSSASREASAMDVVPWKLGRDFRAPTCAVCHASLIVDTEGAVVLKRTHGFGDRLWVRLFGLVYSHPQPLEPDTTRIRNATGQPLPVTLQGEPAAAFLIPPEEQSRRRRSMMTLCEGCHGTQWTTLHFGQFAATLENVDTAVRQGTALMQRAWAEGWAAPESLFDEALERLWTEQWLLCANGIRYTSAMAGAPDHAAFRGGWWGLSGSLVRLREAVEHGRRTAR